MLRLKCWFVGHLPIYECRGPPVSGLGGSWYTCLRCGAFGRFHRTPKLTTFEHVGRYP
jgi:hypothetical protein